MKRPFSFLFLAALLAAAPALLRADDPGTTNAPSPPPSTPAAPPANLLATSNPGFENGLEDWTMDPPTSTMFQVTDDAASIGKKGLQAGTPGDNPNTKAELFSAHVPVQEGQLCRLNFWASFDARSLMCDASLVFYGADGSTIAPMKTPGFWWADTIKYQGGCYPYYLRAIVPAGAVTAGVRLSVRANTKGVAHLDDFSITQEPVPATASNLPPRLPIEPLLADVAANPYNGKPPPMIVIKIDDLTRHALDKWQKIIDVAQAKKIKVNIGIICNSLEGATPADQKYYDWIKGLQAAGLGEFWLHGYDHGNWTGPDGKMYAEFQNRSYDEQKKRFDDSERLAKDKLGFTLPAFGAPGNGFDDTTMKVLADEPDIKVFIYGDAKRPGGKVVLERIGSVNIEQPTFFPRFDQFLGGYVHNRGRPYFVMQGHPWHWNDTDFNEVVEMIDFLISQHASFVTPSELAARISAPPITTSQN